MAHLFKPYCLLFYYKHRNMFTDVRYQRSHGHFLLTCSYDKTAKLWSNPSWHPLRTLSGHDNKVTTLYLLVR